MKKKLKKEVLEWVAIATMIGIIYFTGWHTEVIGRIQQAVLATGIISPSTPDEEKIANYSFWLEDFEGNSISFEEFKDRVAFVNFWATWCPPCVAEMPDIHSLYERKKENTSFVMISLDENEQKARDFIARKDFKFPVYFLRSRLPDTYNTHAIPTTYILGRDGKVVIENHGMAKYNTKGIRNLLDELSKVE